MDKNLQTTDDSKPSARDETLGEAEENQIIRDSAPERSNQKEEKSSLLNSRLTGGNTKEFIHALNNLPTESIPSYTRDYESILTFPEKFMLMMVYIERTASSAGRRMEQGAIHWTSNGLGVVVRDQNALYSKWLKKFFGNLKYDSFIRKVYRWGFKKSPPETSDLPANCQVFSNPYFCREQMDQLCEMKSTTAAKIRPKATKRQSDNPSSQNEVSRRSPVCTVEPVWNPFPLPIPGNQVRSPDFQQHIPTPYVPNPASLLAQQLLALQSQALASNSMIRRSHMDPLYGANDTIDLMRMQLQLNQPQQPLAPSARDLLELLRRHRGENTNHHPRSPTPDLEELIRRLGQYPPR